MSASPVDHRIAAHVALGAKSPSLDRGVILGAAIALQAIYLAVIPLTFECDAATFYAFAKALVGAPGGVVSSARAPLFPLFLAITGTVWPGTFLIAVLAQAAMGVALPLLVYGILQPLGRGPALIAAFLLIASTVPFVGAKLILAESLYTFLVVLSVYFLSRYGDFRDPRAIYAFALSGIAAMLVRWEAEIVLGLGLIAVAWLALRVRGHVRHVIVAISLIAVVLAGYSVARAIGLGDRRFIGTLQSGTGSQLFHRLYMLDPSTVKGVTAPYLRERRARGPRLIAPTLAPVPGALAQYINPENGPATRRLRDLVRDYASKHPESYRTLQPLLDQSAREPDAPPEGPYVELFGRFDGDPNALVQNIFRSRANFRTAHYSLYMATVAERVVGPVASDRLLLAAGLEAARANPRSVAAMIADGFTMTGVALEGVAEVVAHPLRGQSWRDTYPLWDIPDYSRVPFDAGGCASSALPPSMMAEYRFDQRMTNNAFADLAIQVGAFGRNLVRAGCGTVLVIGWWILFIGPRRVLTLPLLFAITAFVVTLGIAVAGGNSKYDLPFMPLLIIAAVSIGAEAARRMAHTPERMPVHG